MLNEILKEINQAIKELNEEGIKCTFNNIIVIDKTIPCQASGKTDEGVETKDITMSL